MILAKRHGLGGTQFSIDLDDYVFGVMILYVDIIGMFMYVLMLLGGGGGNR